jgi:hypothetical protein
MTCKNIIKSVIIGFAVHSILSFAIAGGLAAPFEVESASVLPPSIRNPRFKNVNTWVESKYNSNGKIEGLGDKLNKNVIWEDLIATRSNETQKNLLKGTLDTQNLSSTDTVGNITGAVNAYANVNVPVLAYGVSENWTLALAVPIYKIDLSMDSGFVVSQNTQGIINQVKSSDPVKASEMSQQLTNPLVDKVRAMGYKPLESEHITALGDIKLVSKYKLFGDDENVLTFKSELTLPTGTTSDVDKLIELPTGDGQFDVGLGLIWDRTIHSKITWNVYGIANLQLPDHLKRRIPNVPEGGLTPDVESVYRDSGDQYLAGTSIQFGSTKGGLYANMGYVYQYMQPTKFKGSLFARERYDWLEDQFGSQQLTSMVGSLGYSTIESYRTKEFPIPLQANIGFGRPLAGRNATAADVYMAELVLFF